MGLAVAATEADVESLSLNGGLLNALRETEPVVGVVGVAESCRRVAESGRRVDESSRMAGIYGKRR